MSLAAIQDNLVKAPLVQQTHTRGDDVARGQEIHQAAQQREQDRQGDQVVLHTKEAEQEGLRPDEEREKDQRRKKQQQEEEAEDSGEENKDEKDKGPRSQMRRLNILA